MSFAAEASESSGRVVGKKGLCAELEWSRMKLERRLLEDGAFPIKTRGTQAGGWEFEVDAVLAYLRPETESAGPEAAPAAKVGHLGEETARQRRDAAQAQLLEDKIALARGELVRVPDLRMALAEGIARMSTSLNKLPETLVRRLNLPETALPVIRQEIDDARRHIVTATRAMKIDG